MLGPFMLRRRLVKARAGLAESLAMADSRTLPQNVLESVHEAHHSLTEAIARLHELEAQRRGDESA